MCLNSGFFIFIFIFISFTGGTCFFFSYTGSNGIFISYGFSKRAFIIICHFFFVLIPPILFISFLSLSYTPCSGLYFIFPAKHLSPVYSPMHLEVFFVIYTYIYFFFFLLLQISIFIHGVLDVYFILLCSIWLSMCLPFFYILLLSIFVKLRLRATFKDRSIHIHLCTFFCSFPLRTPSAVLVYLFYFRKLRNHGVLEYFLLFEFIFLMVFVFFFKVIHASFICFYLKAFLQSQKRNQSNIEIRRYIQPFFFLGTKH